MGVSRFFDWFWQGERIRSNRVRIAEKSHRRRSLERYARTTAEAADRVLDPVTPLRAGSGEAVCALLYKESIRASLAALGRSISSLIEDDTLRAQVARSLSNDVSLERVYELLTEPPAVEGLEGDPRVRTSEAKALAHSARTLLDIAQAPERQLERAFLLRSVRTSLGILVLALGVFAGVRIGFDIARGPDLATAKPWRASSSYEGFDPEARRVDGNRTRVFFHTKRERDPWVELDLEEPTTIRRVDVRNRRDCCRDRAFPLAIEGSLDGKTWRELGRRTEPFGRWTLKLEPTTVRYVRAKGLKRTFLHLESLEVR